MDAIRVGAFELCPSERSLCSQGRRIDIGARAFDLLLVLVEQAGHLVSKATLLDRVWPGLVVEENNLAAQVASLRRVLGAGMIRTVPGFGYRLEAAVEPLHVQATAASPAPGNRAPSPGAVAPDLPGTCAPSWPVASGPMIGRDQALRDTEQALTAARLVTLVGMAGVGKTRLAQELAQRAAQRSQAIAWIALAALSSTDQVASSIAVTMGVSLPDGADGFGTLARILREEPLLLVLDGGEHLSQPLSERLRWLIGMTRALRVLLTSQVPLGLEGEHVLRLEPLATSDAAECADATGSAVTLFAQRVSALDRHFSLSRENAALIGTICRRLDGIPLALELAAARVPALGLNALLERLDDRFRLLRTTRGAREARHSTLYAAFEWSYGLLDASEQRAFKSLAGFAGSFTLRAATRRMALEGTEAADAVDVVARLVDRSLLAVIPVEPRRYVLAETARLFARERLAADGELAAGQARMAEVVLATLDAAYEQYWSMDEAEWLHLYEPEIDNARAALDWAVREQQGIGAALFGSAWPLLAQNDRYAEGRARYEQGLALLCSPLPAARLGRFWEAIAVYDAARQAERGRFAAEVAATQAARAGDARAHYFALTLLAAACREDIAAATAALSTAQSLQGRDWPARLLAHGALTEGALHAEQRQFAQARACYQRAVGLALATSERQALLATVQVVELDIACGEPQAALRLGEPLALSLQHVAGHATRLQLQILLFQAHLLAGTLEQARRCGAEAYALARQLEPEALHRTLDAMALLASLAGAHALAARLAHCADLAHRSRGELRRRPAAQRIREALEHSLRLRLGEDWRAAAQAGYRPLSERQACELALGLADE